MRLHSAPAFGSNARSSIVRFIALAVRSTASLLPTAPQVGFERLRVHGAVVAHRHECAEERFQIDDPGRA